MCILLYVDISMSRNLDEVRSVECHMIGYPQHCLRLSTLHTAHPTAENLGLTVLVTNFGTRQ